ncbi:MAG TPA: hypothetical protein VFR81_26965 [Longimicrobium sp.]|nr:hypothetical protein [Longimicrobium sp.]
MKKLTLDLNALAVESFDAAPAVEARGTVLGRETRIGDCVDGGPTEAPSCAYCDSDYYSCDPCHPEEWAPDTQRRIIVYS